MKNISHLKGIKASYPELPYCCCAIITQPSERLHDPDRFALKSAVAGLFAETFSCACMCQGEWDTMFFENV